MPLPQKLNSLVVDDLEKRLGGLQDCLLIGHDALPGIQTFELRGRLRQAKCRMRVVKNATARVAFDRAGLGTLGGHLQGASALIYGEGKGEAILEISKIVTDWNKDATKKPVTVKAGLMARAPVAAADVARLAAIPPRQVLLTQVARGVQAPLSQMVGALAALPRKLAGTVKAVADKRAAEGQGAAA